jgi:hypothetical protein
MKPYIIICMPLSKTYSADARTVHWAETQARRDDVDFLFVASNACEQGRNVMVQLARSMALPPTHILTLDSDHIPQPDMLDRLLAHDVNIVAGCYPLSINGVGMWSFKLAGEEEWWHGYGAIGGGDPRVQLGDREGYPLLEASTLAGGCVLSRIEVFEAIEYPWHRTEYQPMDEQGVSLQRDEGVFFSDRARECGYTLHVDVSCTVDHFNYVALGQPALPVKAGDA